MKEFLEGSFVILLGSEKALDKVSAKDIQSIAKTLTKFCNDKLKFELMVAENEGRLKEKFNSEPFSGADLDI